jgi:ABC-2 type transport system permease protein
MSGRSAAVFERTFREFTRNRAMLFWTIGWPAIWLVLGSIVFTSGTPNEWLPQVKGSMTITMIGFALMTAGMGNLAGSIARDKEKGAYQKIASTPVKPWEDALGRLIGLLTFALVGSIVVLIIGMIIGAKFDGGVNDALQSIAYAFLVVLSSSGIGLIVSSMTKTEGAAIQIGIGLTVITASISGLFTPYSMLPNALKQFSQLYPPSAAISSIIYLLQGETLAGYNPLTLEHVIYTLISSLALFMIGLFAYEEKLWAHRL